jgi:co-chaperonin GroES (HSP10)
MTDRERRMGKYRSSLMIPLLAALVSVQARVLEVGPGKAYSKPSLAAAAVQNGDTVLFASTVFAGDAATWKASNLVLRAAAPYAHLRADGANAQGKGTWVIQGANTVVENIEFSGAAVPDQNGAGIRQEGANLTVRHCYFHDNENGILTGAETGDVIIEYTEFSGNGHGDGYTHNMYIGNTNSFTLRFCYTHHAKVGHNIKSRAKKNYILNNRSLDGADGTASYELDLPNGGLAVIAGNVFQQGPATDNPTILAYGEEGLSNPAGAVQIVNNTFVNDRPSGGTFISLAAATAGARVINNLFTGAGTLLSGKADTAGNVSASAPGFLNAAAYDYRLAATSPAIDKGKDPGVQDGVPLLPTQQFLPPNLILPRVPLGLPDAGAYEYDPTAAVRQRSGKAAPPRPAALQWMGWGWSLNPKEPVDGLGRSLVASAPGGRAPE